MMEIIRMTNDMAMELKKIKMEINTKVNLLMVRRMERAHLYFKINQFMMDNGKIIIKIKIVVTSFKSLMILVKKNAIKH